MSDITTEEGQPTDWKPMARILGAIFVLYFVYRETGPATTFAVGLLAIIAGASKILMERISDNIKDFMDLMDKKIEQNNKDIKRHFK